ncbi:MAG: ribosome maturation factor RimP [Clostridia bacterium]
MAKIEAILEEIALPICQDTGVYIYECEYKKEGGSYYLRLFIDKDGGVTIDDCENVSRKVNDKLDELDPIKEEYIFEVSSPGIDRKLTRNWHFEKALGKGIDVKLFAPIEGSKSLSGTLIACDEDTLTIDYGGKIIQIEKSKASSIRLAFEF